MNFTTTIRWCSISESMFARNDTLLQKNRARRVTRVLNVREIPHCPTDCKVPRFSWTQSSLGYRRVFCVLPIDYEIPFGLLLKMNQLLESESLQLSIASLRMGAVSKLQKLTTDLVISQVTVNHNEFQEILPEISLMEVSTHDCISDCWVVIYDRVYNVTKFMESVSRHLRILE